MFFCQSRGRDASNEGGRRTFAASAQRSGRDIQSELAEWTAPASEQTDNRKVSHVFSVMARYTQGPSSHPTLKFATNVLLCPLAEPLPTRAVLVGRSLDPVTHKPPAPPANSVLMHPKSRTNLFALKPLGAEQDHPASVRKRPCRLMSWNLCLKEDAPLVAQDNFVRQTPHHRIISRHTSFQ